MATASGEKTVACDESGNEGENLTRAGSRVFAHASVDLTLDEASDLMEDVRWRTGAAAAELKSSTLLKPVNREVLDWFLNEPRLRGRTNIYLVDKQYFVCGKIIDLVVETHLYEQGHDLYTFGRARDLAVTLHTDGPNQLGPSWVVALDQFNTMLRSKMRTGTRATLADFYATIELLRPQTSGKLRHALRLIHAAQAEAETLIREMPATSLNYLALDPLFASLGMTARIWFERTGLPIRMVHDETSLLTKNRVNTLRTGLRQANIPAPGISPVTLRSVIQVDSKKDARVQVADLLAGAGRVIGESELAGSPHLSTAYLRPHLHSSLNWGDSSSYLALTGTPI